MLFLIPIDTFWEAHKTSLAAWKVLNEGETIHI